MIYSIGHGAREFSAFLAHLRAAKIEVLVDVRHYPGSRKHPHFGQEQLQTALEKSNISYLSFVDLGGRRTLNKDQQSSCKHSSLRVKAFRAYAFYMETDSFAAALKHLEVLARDKRVAYMCSETVWWKCHRRMISDQLMLRGWDVQHLGLNAKQPEKYAAHPIWDCCRQDAISGQLCYDKQEKRQKKRKAQETLIEMFKRAKQN